MTSKSVSAILLIHCKDKKGIVSSVSSFVSRHNGNILHLDQHVDETNGTFFMRVEWDIGSFDLSRKETADAFALDVGKQFSMHFNLHYSDQKIRTAIFASKESHCLLDLLSRSKYDGWPWDIRMVISNHPDLKEAVTGQGYKYVHIPVTGSGKLTAEKKQLMELKKERCELIVLARYMQVLSKKFCSTYPEQIINIHHSFLPAFPGSKPYHNAFERGVKIIGATSHFATPKLDSGPIIDQDTTRVSHEDSVKDMIRKGRDLERIVLARAVWQFLDRRILVYGNKTINFM